MNSREEDEELLLIDENKKLKLQLEEEKAYSKQAAEYGLSILEEFKKLQNRNIEIENELESCKNELDLTHQVCFFIKF
jgi:hypothetical protein